ncbi:hypothetical protein ACFQH6_06605 [Halobacteriaceae archaeon GCM10025711]
MGVYTVLKAAFGQRDRPQVIFECRNCGTTLAIPGEGCPYCGVASVERFEIQ